MDGGGFAVEHVLGMQKVEAQSLTLPVKGPRVAGDVKGYNLLRSCKAAASLKENADSAGSVVV